MFAVLSESSPGMPPILTPTRACDSTTTVRPHRLLDQCGAGDDKINTMKLLYTSQEDVDSSLFTTAHTGDAGIDLAANEDAFLAHNQQKLIGTGISVAIPEGYVGLLCTRSGNAHKKGLVVVNSPGIIDSGYRGELKVNLTNRFRGAAHIKKGDRIAQLVIVPCATPELVRVDELPESHDGRGTNGHGSTGTAGA